MPQTAVGEMFEPNISKLTMVIQVIEERLELGHKNKFRCLHYWDKKIPAWSHFFESTFVLNFSVDA